LTPRALQAAGQDGPLSPDPESKDGVSTKTSGTFLNGAAGPKGGGQEARNTVVHRHVDKTTGCRLIAPEFKANLLQFRTNPLKSPPIRAYTGDCTLLRFM